MNKKISVKKATLIVAASVSVAAVMATVIVVTVLLLNVTQPKTNTSTASTSTSTSTHTRITSYTPVACSASCVPTGYATLVTGSNYVLSKTGAAPGATVGLTAMQADPIPESFKWIFTNIIATGAPNNNAAKRYCLQNKQIGGSGVYQTLSCDGTTLTLVDANSTVDLKQSWDIYRIDESFANTKRFLLINAFSGNALTFGVNNAPLTITPVDFGNSNQFWKMYEINGI